MKIAQMVIKPTVLVNVEEIDELTTDSERGQGGFGSSGLL
ncbi:deoxyuridine 5'-triphosphate nucleotidohydrolase [Clostridium putrefaciens]|nr:deoxyuridine 5'-triphosphate nucleotidohydrolase [Clostridium putrefaciens]SUY72774.1 deoxyuridine 5'-triphosphate nucleotidohydrolase [Clostridium putrefaciens]